MKIHRPTLEVIDVSDLSVSIACELRNSHLLNLEYMSAPPYNGMAKEQKINFLIEETAIEIDRVMNIQGDKIDEI